MAVAVQGFEAVDALKTKGCGERGQHCLGDDAGAGDEVVEDLDVVGVLENGGEVDVC